jgi:alkanesulfonate monooxygenase
MAHFHWFTPLHWDGRDLRNGRDGRSRMVTPEYRAEVIAAAERLGFESTLCMVGNGVNDPWLTAASLIATTSRINFIVAVRTGYTHPTVIAQQVESFQNLSRGRLWLNFVSVSHEAELRSFGDFLDKQARYRRSEEFIEVLNHCYDGKPFDYKGAHFQVEQGGLPAPLHTRPRHFTSGSSPAGLALGARFGDVHLSYGETPPMARDGSDVCRKTPPGWDARWNAASASM